MMVTTVSDKIDFYRRVFGRGYLDRGGKNYGVWCPICRDPKRDKRKLVIDVKHDLCHCWVCGYKSRTLVHLLYKYGTPELLNEYKERFLTNVGKNFLGIDLSGPDHVTLPKGTKLIALGTRYDPDYKAMMRYLESRGLDNKDVWRYKLSYSNEPRWYRRIIVPSFDAMGDLNFFVARAIDKQHKPKYDMPGMEREGIIFNQLNVDWSKRLVLCEGSFDMFKCGDNVVPILGSELNEKSLLFSEIVANQTPIALALDPDTRDSKVPRILRKLQEYDIDVVLVDVSPYADPGDMSSKEFTAALNSAKHVTWFDAFFRRLDKASRTRLSI